MATPDDTSFMEYTDDALDADLWSKAAPVKPVPVSNVIASLVTKAGYRVIETSDLAFSVAMTGEYFCRFWPTISEDNKVESFDFDVMERKVGLEDKLIINDRNCAHIGMVKPILLVTPDQIVEEALAEYACLLLSQKSMQVPHGPVFSNWFHGTASKRADATLLYIIEGMLSSGVLGVDEVYHFRDQLLSLEVGDTLIRPDARKVTYYDAYFLRVA